MVWDLVKDVVFLQLHILTKSCIWSAVKCLVHSFDPRCGSKGVETASIGDTIPQTYLVETYEYVVHVYISDLLYSVSNAYTYNIGNGYWLSLNFTGLCKCFKRKHGWIKEKGQEISSEIEVQGYTIIIQTCHWPHESLLHQGYTMIIQTFPWPHESLLHHPFHNSRICSFYYRHICNWSWVLLSIFCIPFECIEMTKSF